MRRVSLLLTLLLLGACSADELERCPAAAGASATCEQACNHLFEIDCRVGETVDDCLTTCASRTASLDFAVQGRLLACYAGASDCVEVDGCARTCGPGDGPIDFPTDGGGAGADAGPACTDDSLEDDDEPGTATAVGLPSSTAATACPADADHFSFGLTAGASVTATATFGAGSLLLELLDSGGTPLSTSGEGPSPRTLTYTATENDTLFIRVTAPSGGAPEYTLDLTSP